MSRYTPELGQAVFGQAWGEFDVGDLGSAAVWAVLQEIKRVMWNREQREVSFRSEEDAETWNDYGSGIEWHAYWWGDDDVPEAARPNLTFEAVNVRWYKWPGRGETVDREMTPDAWSTWLSNALIATRAADRDPSR